MTGLKPALSAALAALACSLPGLAQGNDNTAGLLPPDVLFAPPVSPAQKLYNDASTCSGSAAQLRMNAAMFATRALNETTAARRRGDEAAAEELNMLFVNAVTIRSSAATAADGLDGLRAELALLPGVSDAGGRILHLSGARQMTAMTLDGLPPGGQPLQDALFHLGVGLLADLNTVNECLTDVNAAGLPKG